MPISGRTAVKILQKNGFTVSRQRGSHIIMTMYRDKDKVIAVVPNHKEVQKGTLRSIARMSGISEKEFGL
jgi:predicted RNA binding protein YcfA (HicA-like mRNA interferase family)